MESHCRDVQGHRADDESQKAGVIGGRGDLLYEPRTATKEKSVRISVSFDKMDHPKGIEWRSHLGSKIHLTRNQSANGQFDGFTTKSEDCATGWLPITD